MPRHPLLDDDDPDPFRRPPSRWLLVVAVVGFAVVVGILVRCCA